MTERTHEDSAALLRGDHRPTRLVILGSTGSIGRQALDVVAKHPDRFEVVALAAGSDANGLAQQAARFDVDRLALADPQAADRLRLLVPDACIGSGSGAIVELAALDDVDVVLNALVGAAGLRASIATLEAGITLALANKESLVVGGRFVMDIAAPGQLVPVDSEP